MIHLLVESGFRVEERCNSADVKSLAWTAIGVRSAADESWDGIEDWRPGTATGFVEHCYKIEGL